MAKRRARCLCLVCKEINVYGAAGDEEAITLFLTTHYGPRHPDETGKLTADGIKVQNAVNERKMTEDQQKAKGLRLMRRIVHLTWESGSPPAPKKPTLAQIRAQHQKPRPAPTAAPGHQHHHSHQHSTRSH